MSDDAAKARADFVRALKEERHGYEVAGKADRIKAVDAELARFDAAPAKRTAPSKDKSA